MIRPLTAAALGLLWLAAPAMAQTSNQPIPGINVVVKKQPTGNALVVGQSGRDGWFSGRVRIEGGEFEVSAACPPRRQCPAFRLASVSVDGRVITPNARGQFIFPVGSSIGQIMLHASVVGQPASTPR